MKWILPALLLAGCASDPLVDLAIESRAYTEKVCALGEDERYALLAVMNEDVRETHGDDACHLVRCGGDVPMSCVINVVHR